MRKSRRAAQSLRLTVELLPRETREAMLRGVDENEIIVGAYADRSGGVCPMLAAHRCGGRTNFGSFARAWDRFTAAGPRSRRATERELTALRGYLESSLLREEQDDKSLVELSAELRASRRRSGERLAAEAIECAIAGGGESAPTRRPGDRDRAAELRNRRGWSWLRPARRYDVFVETLAAAEEQISEQRADEFSRERDAELV